MILVSVKENIDKIFEPFFTTDNKLGTGLRLHIVYNLVTQQLNGTISCNSQVKKRTTFKVSIPI
jgi:signal transduction histidine kinase